MKSMCAFVVLDSLVRRVGHDLPEVVRTIYMLRPHWLVAQVSGESWFRSYQTRF
jgi:hypothetical protein